MKDNDKCPHYEPWRIYKNPLNMDECFHYVYYSGRCDCIESKNYNKECLKAWEDVQDNQE